MYAIFTETREFSGSLGLEVTLSSHMDVEIFTRRKRMVIVTLSSQQPPRKNI